jgi:signal transduction histidine kinase
MRERALSLGGVVEITGNPGRGTTVALMLPFVATPGEPTGERS